MGNDDYRRWLFLIRPPRVVSSGPPTIRLSPAFGLWALCPPQSLPRTASQCAHPACNTLPADVSSTPRTGTKGSGVAAGKGCSQPQFYSQLKSTKMVEIQMGKWSFFYVFQVLYSTNISDHPLCRRHGVDAGALAGNTIDRALPRRVPNFTVVRRKEVVCFCQGTVFILTSVMWILSD